MVERGAMLRPQRSLWTALLAGALLAWLAVMLVLYGQTQPQALPELSLQAHGGRVQCVSYAPYHRPGQAPSVAGIHIDAAQIRADLTVLAQSAACVRTYAVDQGLHAVPEIARELGLKVLLGAWIGRDAEHNAAQLEQALALTQQYPDVIEALVVGNEVLLRREQSADQMAKWLQQAQAASAVPVTYADVWEFWLQNAALAQWVDEITVHILPFWEDHPVAVDQAVPHVREVFARMQAHFADKPLRIGETGWPSAGRQRSVARASSVNQARFIREFVHAAQQAGWRYNLIEAIDQPWKRGQEGTVGGFWGILDTGLQAKFPLRGAVAERADIRLPLLASAAMALLYLALGASSKNAAANGWLRHAALASVGALSGLLAVLVWEHALVAWRNAFEWSVLGAVAGGGGLFALGLTRYDGRQPIPAALTCWQAPRCGLGTVAGWLGWLRALLLFAAAVAGLLLAFDPRYRDFPLALYALPALLIAALGVVQPWPENAREERLCALVLLLCASFGWLVELRNVQALLWLGVALLLVLPAVLRPQPAAAG